MRRILSLIITLWWIAVSSLLAQGFSGSGSGTESDPYRIFNADQLNQVRNFLNRSNVCFTLEADIDLAPWLVENNPYEGWQPIGTKDSPFIGTFDGKGHTISNLTINRPNVDYVGLFGYNYNDAMLKNIKLQHCTIIGKDYVGGFVGYGTNDSVNSCVVLSGNISGNNYVGGFVGYGEEVNIYNCELFATITGNECVGGLAGFFGVQSSKYAITNCVTSGFISGTNNVGGLVGEADYINYVYNKDVIISYSSSSMTINGINKVGGAVGYFYSQFEKWDTTTCSISNCSIVSPSILGLNNVGGIVGSSRIEYGRTLMNKSIISHCYVNVQQIIGKNNVGGICGNNESAAYLFEINGSVSINNRLAANQGLKRISPTDFTGESGTSNENKAWVLTKMLLKDEPQLPVEGLQDGTNVGLSTLKLKATYQGLGWSFDSDSWSMQETESFPYLSFQTAPPYFTETLKAGQTVISGQCTEDGIVTVRIGQKEYSAQSTGNRWTINVDPLQGGDLTEISVRAEGKKSSYPVFATVALPGSGTAEDPYLVTTAADLRAVTEDDAYYRLTQDIDLTSWITKNNPDGGWIPIGDDVVGVRIAELDGQGHTISGLRLNDTTHTNVGIFSRLKGTVKNLHLKITEVKATQVSAHVGSLVGTLLGTIEGCSVEGAVTTEGVDIGLIAGLATDKATITACSAKGSVSNSTAAAMIGGIVGKNSGIIDNCYSDVTITGSGEDNYCGGITGHNMGTVSHCYALGDVSGCRIGGVVGYNAESSARITACVALNKRLSATTSAQRVLGSFGSNAPTPGDDNYALSTMNVSVNDKPLVIYDDPLNGYAKTDAALKTEDTYTAHGWTFPDPWTIYEGHSYPFFTRDEIVATSLTLLPTEVELHIGESTNLSVTATPANATNLFYSWVSSNPEIATVNADGQIKAVGIGQSTITVSIPSGLTATITVKVVPILVESITLNKNSLDLNINNTEQLEATLLPDNASNKSLTWSTSDKSIATVTQDGLVLAVNAGQAIITVATNDGSNLTATCTINCSSATGFSGTQVDQISIGVRGFTIYVTGTSKDDVMKVYDLQGRLCHIGTLSPVTVSKHGIYLVVIGSHCFKVCI